MYEFKLDQISSTPLYQQISDQVKHLIATGQLKPGEHLPTVRQLAKSLKINIGTVVRAYQILEQERVVVSRRGGGTIVSTGSTDPHMLMMRQRELSSIISSNIIDLLSIGYSPEELQTAFYMHISRWFEARNEKGEDFKAMPKRQVDGKKILIVGSNDLALGLLIDMVTESNSGVQIDFNHAGSLGGLIALQQDRADMAGIRLLDEETGHYNYPYIKRILPERTMAVMHLAYRMQGLMFRQEHKDVIKGLDDLKNQDLTFINRQKWSGTRVLFDIQLRQHGIEPDQIKGYPWEVDTHMSVALNIMKGEADVGLGIEAVAHTCDLTFLPLFKERYDLVTPIEKYESDLLTPIFQVISSDEFKDVVTNVGGYDISETGTITYCK